MHLTEKIERNFLKRSTFLRAESHLSCRLLGFSVNFEGNARSYSLVFGWLFFRRSFLTDVDALSETCGSVQLSDFVPLVLTLSRSGLIVEAFSPFRAIRLDCRDSAFDRRRSWFAWNTSLTFHIHLLRDLPCWLKREKREGKREKGEGRSEKREGRRGREKWKSNRKTWSLLGADHSTFIATNPRSPTSSGLSFSGSYLIVWTHMARDRVVIRDDRFGDEWSEWVRFVQWKPIDQVECIEWMKLVGKAMIEWLIEWA